MREQALATCQRKEFHRTQSDAEMEVMRLLAKNKVMYEGLKAYKCPCCPGWHTGRRIWWHKN